MEKHIRVSTATGKERVAESALPTGRGADSVNVLPQQF